MRAILALAVLLAGCASSEYSQVPEPTGEWVPANPPSLILPAGIPSLASHGSAPAEPLPASPASFRSTALRAAP